MLASGVPGAPLATLRTLASQQHRDSIGTNHILTVAMTAFPGSRSGKGKKKKKKFRKNFEHWWRQSGGKSCGFVRDWRGAFSLQSDWGWFQGWGSFVKVDGSPTARRLLRGFFGHAGRCGKGTTDAVEDDDVPVIGTANGWSTTMASAAAVPDFFARQSPRARHDCSCRRRCHGSSDNRRGVAAHALCLPSTSSTRCFSAPLCRFVAAPRLTSSRVRRRGHEMGPATNRGLDGG
ncbi:hypothetical protein IWZ03DRAFT_118627 [Phyllosticta citriasiana]|uniref:Uncharacterized protein n=1 Tax=Phyllosticta citriasiana TaxID=595635 RepID=A0ABR1KW87_9PEZI